MGQDRSLSLTGTLRYAARPLPKTLCDQEQIEGGCSKKMKNKNSPWQLAVVFAIAVVIMTLYEGAKELLFQGTLTPWQSHIITIIVTSVIATFSAFIMRSWILSLQLKEKEIESKEKSLKSFELVLHAVNHIVNNILNYIQIIQLDIEDNGKIDAETMKMLDESLNEASKQMKILNEIQAPSDPESYKGIYPE